MSSIQSFCVRWLTLIAIVSGVVAPVSQATAHHFQPCPTSTQEVVAKP